MERLQAEVPNPDVVVLCYGVLGNQAQAEADYAQAEHTFQVNLLSHVSLLTLIANSMEARKQGTIVVVGSVAGDRGRQSNYVYGASKAGLDAFLGGMRNRLFRSNVHVLTVKPGFVETPMTAGVKKNALFADAEKVGASIASAIERKTNVMYVPLFWLPIMTIVKSVPEAIFKRLKL
jgi:short-subunit dehydrogenase